MFGPTRSAYPRARRTSGRPLSPSAATTATGPAGDRRTSRSSPPLASTATTPTASTTPTPALPRSCTTRPDQPDHLGGGQELDGGDDPTNLYAKLGYDTEFWPIGPTGFGIDYTDGEDIAGEGFDGHSFGLAAVQKIDRYNIDLYAQLRWYDLDSDSEPDLKDIAVGTFGTKFTF